MGEAETIADLARRALGADILTTEDGRQFLITPEGFRKEEITDPHGLVVAAPDRIVQGVTLQTLDSLVDYGLRFKTENTVLFADIDANSIDAALDYHGPDSPAHVSHHGRLHLPFSVEWTTWRAVDGKLMPQLEFARFLEENAADIVAPSGADLLEACRDLQAKRTVDFRAAVRTNTDNESFEYADDTQTSSRSKQGEVEVPSKFELRIPVYFGQPNDALFAFLRWKLDEGKLLLGVKLHRAEHVRQAVFKQIVLDAAERIGAPAVFGKI